MKIVYLGGINLALGEQEDLLPVKAATTLKINKDEIKKLDIIRKAVDARHHRPPFFKYTLKILCPSSLNLPTTLAKGIQFLNIEHVTNIPKLSPLYLTKLPVVVIGSGPAGLFAAYILALRGMPSLILERGAPVETRVRDVENFWNHGMMCSQSNVFFGEGGAGTFSDGKLTSRSKNPYSYWVKKVLVEAGAPSEILVDAKPHLGTDKLRKVIVTLRGKLIDMGCRFEFNTQVTDFLIKRRKIAAVVINKKEEIQTNHVILAIGQSADDTYAKLYERGVKLEAKPFAMGLRVEHPQELINSIQYGKWHRHPQLPPAEYFIKASLGALNRSVYTFCMCPGGSVIGCSAWPGSLATNGMSHYQRSGEFANSAIVVNVRVDDFTSGENPLDGLHFRGKWERKAFIAGGGNYFAPAQKTTDFLVGKTGTIVRHTSYLPGVDSTALNEILPDFIIKALRCGIREFEKKMRGFITEESHLIGVETRTSSPVRICRNLDGQSSGIRGIYPCGEGAGYAGGIISSALDGIKAAENLINNLS